MEDRIESPRADLVSVAGKLLGHPRAKDGFMFRMMEDVKTNHAGVKIAIICIAVHYRISLSTHDSMQNLRYDEFRFGIPR